MGGPCTWRVTAVTFVVEFRIAGMCFASRLLRVKLAKLFRLGLLRMM